MDEQPLKLRDEEDAGLNVIRDMLSCETVADTLLKLKGRGPARFCPRCAATRNDGVATLMLGTRYFECGSCYFRGDVIDLVVGVKKCSPEEAIAMLTALSLDLKKSAKIKEASRNTEGSLQARVLAASDDQERGILARMTFLESCRPLKDQVVELLQQQGISRDVMEHAGLRYSPEDPVGSFKKIETSFGRAALAKAGILQPLGTIFSDTTTSVETDVEPDLETTTLQRVFEPYDEAKIRYLAIPYYDLNQLLYIKAIPLVSGKILVQRKLPRSLATAAIAPCPFNAEALSQLGRLIIFRQELDCMAATSAGYSAIAVPSLSRFQAGLVPLLNNRDVYICGDEDLARSKILQTIDTIFVSAGATPPKLIVRKAGESVADVLRREFSAPDPDDLLVESQINTSGLSALAGNEDVTGAAEAATKLALQKRYDIQVNEKLRIVLTPFNDEGKDVVYLRYQKKTLLGSWEDQEWGRIRIDPKHVPDVAAAMVRLCEVMGPGFNPI